MGPGKTAESCQSCTQPWNIYLWESLSGKNEYHLTSMLYMDDTFTMVVLYADSLRKIWKAANLLCVQSLEPNLKTKVGLSFYPGSVHLLQASISSSGTVPPSPGCWRVPWGCENESLCSDSHYAHLCLKSGGQSHGFCTFSSLSTLLGLVG